MSAVTIDIPKDRPGLPLSSFEHGDIVKLVYIEPTSYPVMQQSWLGSIYIVTKDRSHKRSEPWMHNDHIKGLMLVKDSSGNIGCMVHRDRLPYYRLEKLPAGTKVIIEQK